MNKNNGNAQLFKTDAALKPKHQHLTRIETIHEIF
jgi:hypothetical protein